MTLRQPPTSCIGVKSGGHRSICGVDAGERTNSEERGLVEARPSSSYALGLARWIIKMLLHNLIYKRLDSRLDGSALSMQHHM